MLLLPSANKLLYSGLSSLFDQVWIQGCILNISISK